MKILSFFSSLSLATGLVLASGSLRAAAAAPAAHDLTNEIGAIENALTAGKKDEAKKLAAELREKVSARLALVCQQAADASLFSYLPATSDQARSTAAAQFTAARAEIALALQDYAAVVENLPEIYSAAGIPADDFIEKNARLYELVGRQKITLSTLRGNQASLRMEANHAFVERLEKALRMPNAALAKTTAASTIEAGRKNLPAVDSKTTAVVNDTTELASVFPIATGDFATADELATLALDLDALSAKLWATRSHLRLLAGLYGDAYVDLMAAQALDPKNATVTAVTEEFNAVPQVCGLVFQEPVNPIHAAAAARIQAMNGLVTGDEARAAGAAMRNRARRIYLGSFIMDPTRRGLAVGWTLDHHRDQAGLQAVEVKAAGKELTDVYERKDGPATLAAFDRAAPMLAGQPAFWKMRTQFYIANNNFISAMISVDVGLTLTPKDEWLLARKTALKEELARASGR